MSGEAKKSDVGYYLACAFGLFLMFGFGRVVPPMWGLPEVGMQVIGVFLGLVWLWSVAEIIWPSILGVMALGMTDYCNMNQAILNGLGNSTVWQLMMVMVLIGAINESGCGEVLANKILSIKFIQGRPMLFVWIFCVAFMSVAVFLGMLACVLLAWGIAANILKQAGYSRNDKFSKLFVIIIFLACNFGTTVLPFKGVKLSLLKAFSNVSGGEIAYFAYMAFTYFGGVITVTLFILAMKYLWKADFSKLSNVNFDSVKMEANSFTTEGKLYFVGFGIALAYILITSFVTIPGEFYTWFKKIGSTGIFAMIVGVMSIFKYNGKPLLSFKKMAKHIEWNGVFICAAAIQVASALVSDNCGVIALCERVLSPFFAGFTGYLFVVAAVVVCVGLTNVANNIAVGMLMLPIVMSFAAPLGLDINLVGLVVVFSVQLAWMLPGASAPAALLHGNEAVDTIDIYKYGGVAMLVCMGVIAFVLYPLFSLFM